MIKIIEQHVNKVSLSLYKRKSNSKVTGELGKNCVPTLMILERGKAKYAEFCWDQSGSFPHSTVKEHYNVG